MTDICKKITVWNISCIRQRKLKPEKFCYLIFKHLLLFLSRKKLRLQLCIQKISLGFTNRKQRKIMRGWRKRGEILQYISIPFTSFGLPTCKSLFLLSKYFCQIIICRKIPDKLLESEFFERFYGYASEYLLQKKAVHI